MSKLSQRPKPSAKEARPFASMARINPHAAGIDIGAHENWACVAVSETEQAVQCFGTYTADLHALAAWLREHQVCTVAMESTGVYWVPLFELLEHEGFQCHLISAAAIKRVPGRKSDVLDCQWIQTLHMYGLLAASFRPEADLVALRTLLRHRAQLVEHRAPHILHMQKALLQMNLQLSQALSDVTGETGQKIIRAIVAGERDPQRLAALRHYHCKKDKAEIAQALTGTWRAEHLFVLQQSLALFDFYTTQLARCDAEIERTFALIRPEWNVPVPTPELHLKARSHSKNAPDAVQARQHLRRLTGVDLVAVDGFSESLAQSLIAEIGTDMGKWEDDKHFGAWLGLAPKNDISGGKVLVSRTLKTKNRAGQIFRLAARSVLRADCAFGAFYRRLKARLGPAQAIVATAYKIARVVYHMLKHKVEYRDEGAATYERQHQERQRRKLERQAAKLGFKLVPAT